MKKREFVDYCLQGMSKEPYKKIGSASAPMNIALVKYWGKRNTELNLPVTSSLSVSLSLKTSTTVEVISHDIFDRDLIELDGVSAQEGSTFYTRLVFFLDLFRPTPTTLFRVTTKNDMATAAGLASSASGFAALVLALDDLFAWQLPKEKLSLLARLGSGSACRSIFSGFVLWNKGKREDGLDSFATPLLETWPELSMAYIPVSSEQKPISSTKAMQQTVATSSLYAYWPKAVEQEIETALEAIMAHDYTKLGSVAEESALFMHATMMLAKDPILYWLPKSVEVLHRVWQARKDGFMVYATMDAGPNVKILFMEEQRELLFSYFPEAKLLSPIWV